MVYFEKQASTKEVLLSKTRYSRWRPKLALAGRHFGRHLEYRILLISTSLVLTCFSMYTILRVKIHQNLVGHVSCKVEWLASRLIVCRALLVRIEIISLFQTNLLLQLRISPTSHSSSSMLSYPKLALSTRFGIALDLHSSRLLASMLGCGPRAWAPGPRASDPNSRTTM